MVLVSQSIPNLVGGISQQPAPMRRPNQCEDQLNAYSDPVSGLKKRSGTEHVSLTTFSEFDQFFSINRDDQERYIFSVSPAGVTVVDSTGAGRAVNYPDGVSYLSGSNPSYKAVTISDTTFIVNDEVVVSENSGTSPDNSLQGMVFIRAVDFNTTYTVDIDGVGASSVSYTTPSSGAISATEVADQLSTQLNAFSNISTETVGGVIKFTTTQAYNLIAYSSRGENYIIPIPGSIRNFGDLPEVGFNNQVVRITGDPGSNSDDYYVKFIADGNTGVGTWVETIGPSLSLGLDNSTMPHVLVRESDGSFTFREFGWRDRVVGDNDSNPFPSFTGQTINNVFFFRNRLGFLSDVNVVLSESGEVDNFFRSSVSTIIDSDPIDISVVGQKVSVLHDSIEVIDGLLLFSENGQFLLNVGDADVLSPETVSITNISSYDSKTDVAPLRAGDTILFMTERDKKTGVREYFYNARGSETSSANITNHVPFLLPRGIRYTAVSSTESIVLFIDPSSSLVFVYQYLWSGDQKVVSAWGKWSFNSAVVRYGTVFKDYLYLILDRGTETFLERMPLSNAFINDPLKGEVCLDQRIDKQSTTVALNSGNTEITNGFDFFGVDGPSEPTVISLVDKPEIEINIGDQITVLSNSPLTIEGDWTGAQDNFLIGSNYSFYYQFSTPYVKDQNDDSDVDNRTQVRTVTIQLTDTGNCEFEVTYGLGPVDIDNVFISDVTDWSSITDMSSLPDQTKETFTYPLSRDFPEYNLDSTFNRVDHAFRVPIMSENIQYSLRVTGNTWHSVRLTKASWEALYYKRNRRI